jgi:cytosine/uracil/thiamine/allantoin permease
MPRVKNRESCHPLRSGSGKIANSGGLSRQYVQFLVIPAASLFFSSVGIAVTSAGMILYDGKILWNPLNLIDLWTNRPAAFFMSFALALSTLGTNV